MNLKSKHWGVAAGAIGLAVGLAACTKKKSTAASDESETVTDVDGV